MIAILIVTVLVVADQLFKSVCANWLTALPGNTYALWPGVFQLTYVENRGAAFSMLQNARWFFVGITVIACVAMVWFLIKERKHMHLLMKISIALILAGALGNMIDRIFFGYVRDMFYLVIVNFAIFNIADSAVSVGCVLLGIDICFLKGRRYLEGKPNKEPEAQE